MSKPPVAALTGAGAVLGKSSIEDFLCIRVDTREQLPIDFDSEYVKAGRGTVPVFDYAIEGDERQWAIERKSLDDFIQAVVLSASWKRELAKIEKARAWLLPIIYVLEFNYEDIGRYNYDIFKSGKVTSQLVYRRVAELEYDHGVDMAFRGNRVMAAYAICTLLKRRKESLKQTRQAGSIHG